MLRQNAVAFILLGGVGVAGFNGALFVGLQTSDPITASLIMATTPLSANLLESVLNRRLPTQLRIFGAMISLLGVAMVVTNGSFLTGTDIAFASGDLIILLGSLAWAAYTVGCRAFVKNSTPLETTTWTMVSGAITLIALAAILEQPFVAAANASLISHVSTAYMAIAGSVLAYLFWTIGVSVRGPGPTSVFFNFVPVFALLISVIQGNIPGGIQMLGIALTIFGVLVGDGKFMAAKKAQTTA